MKMTIGEFTKKKLSFKEQKLLLELDLVSIQKMSFQLFLELRDVKDWDAFVRKEMLVHDVMELAFSLCKQMVRMCSYAWYHNMKFNFVQAVDLHKANVWQERDFKCYVEYRQKYGEQVHSLGVYDSFPEAMIAMVHLMHTKDAPVGAVIKSEKDNEGRQKELAIAQIVNYNIQIEMRKIFWKDPVSK